MIQATLLRSEILELETHWMRYLRCAAVSALFASPVLASAQAPQPIPIETARTYFAEARSLCQADHGQLWGISLCGPIMFVDPKSRSIVASDTDARGLLKAEGEVFIGSLPADQTIANTAVEWSGVHWTQMLWPLPENERQRETLIAHELFHRIQSQLAVPQVKSGDNAQLDSLDGRYYLQLEWRALARSLEAHSDGDQREAAGDAILFRSMRYSLFPDAPSEEQALELNEGLAEYTGVRVGNPTAEEQIEAALHDLSTHKDDSTFVRSFAYATGPAYGLLLDRYAPGWHQQLKEGDGFGILLRKALHISLPGNLQRVTEQRALQYDGPALHVTEQEREAKRKQVMALYRAEFLDGPILMLPFRHMRVQFDPRNLQPLEKVGTVYPNMHISDDWGILDANNGALMKPDWSAVIIVAPAAVTGSSIKGDGWTLELKPGWKIIPGIRKGDFVLTSAS